MEKLNDNLNAQESQATALKMVVALGCCLFLIMFQIYMVAPLGEVLSREFPPSSWAIALMIPASAISMAIGAVCSGSLRTSPDIRAVAVLSQAILAISASAIAVCSVHWALVAIRALSGLALGFLLPLSLRFISKTFREERRVGPVLGIIFSMAGGMTFGPVAGALLADRLGWRIEFLCIGTVSLILIPVILLYLRGTSALQPCDKQKQPPPGKLPKEKQQNKLLPLLFILLNGIFHSGLFVWTCHSLVLRYRPGAITTGMLLLDFGLPGLLLVVISALIFKGFSVLRTELLGLIILAACIIMLLINGPLGMTLLVIMLLSIGYNITQPLFFGPLGELSQMDDSGKYLRLGCTCLFLGYGIGPVLFQQLMGVGELSSILMLVFLIAGLACISKVIFSETRT